MTKEQQSAKSTLKVVPKKPGMTGREIRDRILFWIVLIISVAGLWYFFANSPKERPYDCDGAAGGSLITFGGCRER